MSAPAQHVGPMRPSRKGFHKDVDSCRPPIEPHFRCRAVCYDKKMPGCWHMIAEDKCKSAMRELKRATVVGLDLQAATSVLQPHAERFLCKRHNNQAEDLAMYWAQDFFLPRGGRLDGPDVGVDEGTHEADETDSEDEGDEEDESESGTAREGSSSTASQATEYADAVHEQASDDLNQRFRSMRDMPTQAAAREHPSRAARLQQLAEELRDAVRVDRPAHLAEQEPRHERHGQRAVHRRVGQRAFGPVEEAFLQDGNAQQQGDQEAQQAAPYYADPIEALQPGRKSIWQRLDLAAAVFASLSFACWLCK